MSHGELVGDGIDQTMPVDPGRLELVFQGMLKHDKVGKSYGPFPWRIGILTPIAGRR